MNRSFSLSLVLSVLFWSLFRCVQVLWVRLTVLVLALCVSDPCGRDPAAGPECLAVRDGNGGGGEAHPEGHGVQPGPPEHLPAERQTGKNTWGSVPTRPSLTPFKRFWPRRIGPSVGRFPAESACLARRPFKRIMRSETAPSVGHNEGLSVSMLQGLLGKTHRLPVKPVATCRLVQFSPVLIQRQLVLWKRPGYSGCLKISNRSRTGPK